MIWNSFGNTCDIVPLLFKHNAIISTNLCHYKYDIVPLVTSFTYRVVYGGTWRHCDVIVTSLMSSSVVRQSLLPWPLMGEDVHVVCIHSRKCDNVYTRHRIHWWKRCRTKCDNVSTRVAHSWPKVGATSYPLRPTSCTFEWIWCRTWYDIVSISGTMSPGNDVVQSSSSR